MVMHSWSRAPQYFDCSATLFTWDPNGTRDNRIRVAPGGRLVEVCNCTHHRSLPLGFLTPRSEPRRLLTVDLRLSTTPGFIFHIEWQCLSAVDNKNRSEALSNGGCFKTSRLFQRTSQLRLAPAAARRTFNQGPQVWDLDFRNLKQGPRIWWQNWSKVQKWQAGLLGCWDAGFCWIFTLSSEFRQPRFLAGLQLLRPTKFGPQQLLLSSSWILPSPKFLAYNNLREEPRK